MILLLYYINTILLCSFNTKLIEKNYERAHSKHAGQIYDISPLADAQQILETESQHRRMSIQFHLARP